MIWSGRRPTVAPAPEARPEGPRETVEKPLLVYVNVPFCNSKCHFCDWVAEVPVADLRLRPETPVRRRYLEALTAQIAAQAPLLKSRGHRPVIMYWGGGTASILTPAEMTAILGALHEHLDLTALDEVTIEGSPESMTAEKLSLLRSSGFNRVSLGVQSFDPARLRQIGRVHDGEQAKDAVRAARQAGFGNINIDLIVGFPDQPIDEVEATVRTALTLPVNHFSVYPYRSTPGTSLRRRVNRGTLGLDLENQFRAYGRARDLLEEAGHPEYAMSYFGSPRCASDEAYYRLQTDWIGFGSGANSLIDQRFCVNTRGLLHQYNEHPEQFDSVVPAASHALLMHFVSQALTTAEGLAGEDLERRTGMSLPQLYQVPVVRSYLDRMADFGAVRREPDRLWIRREDISRVYVALNWVGPPDAETGPRPVAVTS
jgi:oxygen-independent coproporphyrinogen-3 oxidase